jgi:hypothetical protein
MLAVCGLWAIGLAGCVGHPYQPGDGWQALRGTPTATATANVSPQVCEGSPNKVIDCTGWALGIPGKILLFDRRVNNHDVTPVTTDAVAEYLKQNQMPDVCVRINEYAPGEEWRRLCANTQVGAGWRYTFGTLSLVGYTLIPGRLFGGDRYNPYTNSVYVYSDVPALAIQAAAYAKDVHQRNLPGTYAFVNELPFVSLWHDTVNTREALDYFVAYGDPVEQAEAQRILYPHYAMKVGGAVGGVVGAEPLFVAGSAVVGHVSGRVQKPQESTLTPVVEASPQGVEPASLPTGANPAQDNARPIVRVQHVDD